MSGRWDHLADYNADVHRGVTHSPEWDELMAREQEAFDLEQRNRRIAEGYKELSDGVWFRSPTHDRHGWPRRFRLFR